MARDEALTKWSPPVLSIVRIMFALMLLQFGTAKLLDFPHIGSLSGIPPFSLFWFAGVLELVGGALLALGLFTRPVAFVLSGEMAFAYFIEHAPHGFIPLANDGTLAILFCFLFLYLAFAGGGSFSVDALRARQ